jgi:hypothetical protein
MPNIESLSRWKDETSRGLYEYTAGYLELTGMKKAVIVTQIEHHSSVAVELLFIGTRRKHHSSVVCGPLPSNGGRHVCLAVVA